MAIGLGGGDGGSSIDQGAIDEIHGEIDGLGQQISDVSFKSLKGVTFTGAAQQGGIIPATSGGQLVPDGTGTERMIARSVYKDDTLFTAWAAQAAATPYAPPTITSTSALPSGVNGTAYVGFTFTATSDLGGGALTWSFLDGATDTTHVSSLVLNQTTGALTGTPGTTGTFNVTVQCIDELGGKSQQLFTLVVAAAGHSFSLPPVPPTQPAVGVAYSLNTGSFAGGYTTPVFSSASLPNHHLSINSSTGVISGTPLAADYGKSFNVTIIVTETGGANSITKSIQFTIPAQGFSITTTAMPALQSGLAMTSTTIMTSGGTAPIASVTVAAGAYPTGISAAVVGGVVVVSGTPSVSGAYDFTLELTDSTPTTPLVAQQQYTGTIATAPASFAFVVPNNGDLTTVAGTPSDGSVVNVDLMQFVTNPAGAVTFDSGASPTTPSGGLDVNQPVAQHYGGTAKIVNGKTVLNPLLRANDTSGWISQQCHLTLLTSIPGVDIAAGTFACTLGDVGSCTTAQGIANVSQLLSAIAAAELGSGGSQYRLFSSSGTDINLSGTTAHGNPVFIGLHRKAFSTAAYLIAKKLVWWDLANVVFYWLGGSAGSGKQQPVGGTGSTFLEVDNVSNLRMFLNFDARGGSQAAPPAAVAGAIGFLNHGVLLKACDHEQGIINVFNGVGVTGNSIPNGPDETFDFKLGKPGGTAALQVTIAGGWEGDTGAHYASGMVVQQGAAGTPRGTVLLLADHRRHAFGEFAGSPFTILSGSSASYCLRGFACEAGAPVSPAITSPSLWIGTPGSTVRTTTDHCDNAIVALANDGTAIPEFHVNAHTSTNDGVPYVCIGKASADYDIKNSIIHSPQGANVGNNNPVGKCAIYSTGGSGAGSQADTNLGNVTCDANGTIDGLGANAQVRGGQGTIGHPTAPRTAAAPWLKSS